jgi:transposase-like protein
MKIQITLHCPGCQSSNVVKNGHKSYSEKQNYLCKECQRQFIGDHNLSYSGCHSALAQRLKRMFVRGMGIRDIAEVEQISIGKVLYSLIKLRLTPQAKQSHYDELEIDEFWGYVGKKSNKVWLIYAYHRSSGEIVAWPPWRGCLESVTTRPLRLYERSSKLLELVMISSRWIIGEASEKLFVAINAE